MKLPEGRYAPGGGGISEGTGNPRTLGHHGRDQRPDKKRNSKKKRGSIKEREKSVVGGKMEVCQPPTTHKTETSGRWWDGDQGRRCGPEERGREEGGGAEFHGDHGLCNCQLPEAKEK